MAPKSEETKIAVIENRLNTIEDANKSSIVIFPELSITSYTCSDLFQQSSIIQGSIKALLDIALLTKNIPRLRV